MNDTTTLKYVSVDMSVNVNTGKADSNAEDEQTGTIGWKKKKRTRSDLLKKCIVCFGLTLTHQNFPEPDSFGLRLTLGSLRLLTHGSIQV